MPAASPASVLVPVDVQNHNFLSNEHVGEKVEYCCDGGIRHAARPRELLRTS